MISEIDLYLIIYLSIITPIFLYAHWRFHLYEFISFDSISSNVCSYHIYNSLLTTTLYGSYSLSLYLSFFFFLSLSLSLSLSFFFHLSLFFSRFLSFSDIVFYLAIYFSSNFISVTTMYFMTCLLDAGIFSLLPIWLCTARLRGSYSFLILFYHSHSY